MWTSCTWVQASFRVKPGPYSKKILTGWMDQMYTSHRIWLGPIGNAPGIIGRCNEVTSVK